MKKQILLGFIISIPLCAFSPKVPEYSYVFSCNKYNSAYLEKKEHIRKIMNTIAWQETRNKNNLVGGSGERGAYQIMPSTWKGWCKMYFGKYRPMTVENQTTIVELVITNWVRQGLSLQQIAAKWNCGTHVGWKNKVGINVHGVPYNVPAYVNHFIKQYYKS